MSEYQLELKQIVDYPRCRIYRQFIGLLMKDKSIRVGGTSGLYHFTVLSCFANFRTSYKRIDGISYTIYPGEWLCRVSELTEWFRTRFQHQALAILRELQDRHLITYTLLGRGRLVKFKIKGWCKYNRVLEYNAPCQKDTGFFFLPISVANELVSAGRCSEMDAMLDLWINTVYNDTQVQGSEVGPVVYMRNGTGSPLIGYAELAQRWGVSKATAGRYLRKMQELDYLSMVAFPGTHGTAIYLKQYLSTMFQISDVMIDKDEVATNPEKHLYERSKRNVLTSGAASCYPFTAYELSDDNGILLGVNKYNNSLVIVDIFNSAAYKNANIAIMGTSGAGKTFTLQLMALRMRRKGTQVFIIAPLKGHEFLRACRNTGGEFIQISPASKNCINVMEIRKTDRSVDELLDGAPIEKSELAAKIQQLHIFFSLLIPDITHEERQLLDEALIKTYNAKGITHDNDTLTDPDDPDRYREMPILGDLYDILITAPETKRLANILNRLVHGSASTFNQRTNVNLDNKYTVLDISELSGDLLTAGMFVALDYVWDKTKQNRTVEKTIFIDECWALIGGSANRLAANFVLEIAKIIRGYGGSAVFATQDLNDFFALDDGKYGKGIINNCKTKIVLNLEDEEAQRVQSILHLSEAEVMEITHFERGNGLISTNNNNITVEFRCSDLEKSLITTDRRELQELVEQKKR